MQEFKKLSDRVYYLTFDQGTDRPCLYYVNGSKYSLAIDAGNSCAHVQLFYDYLEKDGLRKPDFTVITHWHWDHTFGMHAVHGMTITGSQTHKKLCEVKDWEWTNQAMQQRLRDGLEFEGCDLSIRKEYLNTEDICVVTADFIFQDRMIIDLGGIHCELREVNAPHSRDSVIIYIPEERMLAVGDADCGDFYENGGRHDKTRLEAFLDCICNYDCETYLRGHDNPQVKDEVVRYFQKEIKKL